MPFHRSSLVAITCLLASACATTGTGPGRAAKPEPERMRTAPPSRAAIEFIGYEQAVALASGYALGTGNLLRVIQAEREGDRWKVQVDVQALQAPRRAALELDATTGELLELRSLPLGGPEAPPAE